jgi:CHAD domain-containing protein
MRARELVAPRNVASALAAALGNDGRAAGPPAPQPVPLRRTWLDTFDWRLHRAGLELEQVELNGTTTFELTGDHGLTASSASPVEWPAPAAVLPAGPLRERVAGVAGIRSLIETACFEGSRTTWPVLDDDAKTVARLHVDAPVGDTMPARVTVTPLRGYDREAADAVRALAVLDGVAAAPASCYDECLAAGGRGRAGSRGPAITAEMPAAAAVAGVLRGFLATVEANVPGVLADIDTEFLHDLRVAVRRTRATVKQAGAVLPAALEPFAAELKWLGDATTPTRDLDVYLLGVPAMAKRLRAARPVELDAFRAHLAERRAEAFAQLTTDLRAARFESLLACWRDVATVDPGELAPGPSAAEFGAACLRRAHRRVVKLGSAITPWTPAEQLHELRKRCKELRYLLEIFEPIEPPKTRTRVLPVLKALQDCLGEFQDSEVQAGAIRTFAAEMMAARTVGPGTLLAMGELAAQLDGDQGHARATFAATFGAFSKATRKLHWTAGDQDR